MSEYRRNTNLLIFGAGQYSHIAKETAEALGYFEKIDFLDDNSPRAIGKLEDYFLFKNKYEYAFVAIGRADLKLELIKKLKNCGVKVVTLIHPKAYVSPSVVLGEGSIVEPMAVIQSNSQLGVGCYISAGASVNHNCILEDCVHVDCGAVIPSNRTVPMGSHIQCGVIYGN